MDVTPNDGDLLLFFYDCETTGGSYHHDHFTEVATTVIVVPDGVHITNTEFSSLCHTSCHIAWKGSKHIHVPNIAFLFISFRKMWDHIIHAV